MNPFFDFFELFSSKIFWQSPKTSLTYGEVKKTIDSLADHITLPERTLVAIQEENPFDVLTHVFALWKKGCVPVLIAADTPADMMNELEAQVPFGEECPEGNLVFFSSGSQGTPKGIVHSVETLLNSAIATNQYYELEAEEKWGLTLPIHHTGGFMILLRCLIAGATIYHADKWREVLKHPCQFYSLVPTQLQDSLSNENLNTARVVLIGGSAMAQDLLDQANEKHIPLFLSYGMTETAAQITSTKKNPPLSTMAGFALPGSEILLNEDSKIAIKSNALMVGQYTHGIFHEPDLDEGWFIQKDIGEMNENGLLIKGRSDRIFISGGENINPMSIEKALMELPQVQSAFVEAVDDPKFGKVPIALIEADEKDLNLIKEELQFKLPKYMLPKEIIPFTWDVERGLKPDQRLKSLLINLNQIKKEVHFHFEMKGTLSKPILIMLHGFMGSTKEWDTLVKELHSEFFLLSIDLPGHGKTESKSYSSQDEFLNDLESFVSLLSVHSPIGLGYSMGGRMLLQLEKRRPGLFSQLILESVHPGINNSEEKRERLEKDSTLLDGTFTTAKFRDFLESWYSLPLFKGIKEHAQYEEMLKAKLQEKPSELQAGINLLSTAHQEDCFSVFEQTQTPILYMAGADDQKYAQFARDIENLGRSNIRVQIVSGCSHNIHFQDQNLFLESIRAALK
jgi:o-succinylbenzoate---CoA ligase